MTSDLSSEGNEWRYGLIWDRMGLVLGLENGQ
jgi:hypothetical protein